MIQEVDIKQDVLLTVRIELERVFTVLSNMYNRDPADKHEPFLKEVEARLKESLTAIEQN